MAEFADSTTESQMILKDAGSHPAGFIKIGEGGSVHFTCLVMNVNGVSYY
jgi:6-phosphogluconate dehydrogenase (decarboxylating)